MVFLVVLDARSDDPDAVRTRVEEAIKKLGNYSNRLRHAWLLETRAMGARGIRDALKEHVTDRDRLFVARISRNWAGRNMGPGFPEWMGRRDFGQFPNG